MIALKIVKLIITWKKKMDFADFVKDAKSVEGFSPSCQDSFKMAASEVASFETNFFRIPSTSEAETSVS